MPFWRFTVLTTLGCIPWVFMLTFIGKQAGDNWEKWKDNLHYVDYAVAAAIVLGIIWLIVRRRRALRRVRRRCAAAEAIALGLLQGPVGAAADLLVRPRRAAARPLGASRARRERKEIEVALHAGTALALALFERRRPRIGLLIAATAPPAVAGLALERAIEERLGTPRSIAAGLLAGAAAMVLADRTPRSAARGRGDGRRRRVAGRRAGAGADPGRLAQRGDPRRRAAARVRPRRRGRAVARGRAAGARWARRRSRAPGSCAGGRPARRVRALATAAAAAALSTARDAARCADELATRVGGVPRGARRRGRLAGSGPMTDAYAASGRRHVRRRPRRGGARRRAAHDRDRQTSRTVPLPGHYAAVLEVAPNLGIAVGTDGVGSKLLVAEATGRLDTVGIDCVAMNVNDVVCVGAEPIALLDYLAVEQADPEAMRAIAEGSSAAPSSRASRSRAARSRCCRS